MKIGPRISRDKLRGEKKLEGYTTNYQSITKLQLFKNNNNNKPTVWSWCKDKKM